MLHTFIPSFFILLGIKMKATSDKGYQADLLHLQSDPLLFNLIRLLHKYKKMIHL